ncbi:coiled-coil domain-containing protein 134-like [Bradysia coprophila]|uniref:coiled-coil domain-containing protein 134-like n=1 Tax=Bradysia coprophila TaxID=38358 RepID=UPI00187DC59F|nr:coiled-coil domain-containing protein 134-like [Bradysia coprophila]
MFYLLFLMVLSIPCDGQNADTGNQPLINAQIYSSMFVRRREEHKTLLDHFQRTEKYDRKFKLLEIGINQILAILRENRPKLVQENYSTSGFPKTSNMIDALTLVVENTCLIGDLILHMPDLSDKILSKDNDWKETLNWAVQFTVGVHDVVDPKTRKMLSLVDQEINVERRTSDYINPYREIEQPSAKKRSKEKKKLKKGPQLRSAGRTEL